MRPSEASCRREPAYAVDVASGTIAGCDKDRSIIEIGPALGNVVVEKKSLVPSGENATPAAGPDANERSGDDDTRSHAASSEATQIRSCTRSFHASLLPSEESTACVE